MASCGCASATEFYCGPAMEAGVEFDNLRSSSVQMAPVALQSVVSGRVMLMVQPLVLYLFGDAAEESPTGALRWEGGQAGRAGR